MYGLLHPLKKFMFELRTVKEFTSSLNHLVFILVQLKITRQIWNLSVVENHLFNCQMKPT